MNNESMKQYLFETIRILLRPHGKPTSRFSISVLVKRLAKPYLEKVIIVCSVNNICILKYRYRIGISHFLGIGASLIISKLKYNVDHLNFVHHLDSND